MNWLQLLLTVVTVGGIYAILALGLNLQLGYTGLINFGIVAYFAAGAYAYVIAVQPPPSGTDTYLVGLGLPIGGGVVAGCAAAVVLALLTGWPCLRLRGEYLALMTFAFAQVFESFIVNATSITNGTRGFNGLAQPFAASFPAASYGVVFAGLVVLFLLVVFVVAQRLVRAPFGRTLLAIQDDEVAAALAEKPIQRYRMQVFLLGGLVYGLAGVLYAWYSTVVTPGQFSTDITVIVFIALALGGIGSNIGAVVGAVILVAFEELTRVLAVDPAIEERIGAVRLALLGLLFIVLLRLRRGGRASAAGAGTSAWWSRLRRVGSGEVSTERGRESSAA